MNARTTHTPQTLSRRRLLTLAGAAAGTSWLPRSAWSQPRLAGDPFALGVASGSPTHDGVVLWTRLAGVPPAQAATVQWEVAHDEAFARLARAGQAQALPELGHSVHAEVQGLAPDRWYFYRFIAGGVASPVGRTRTFPEPQARAARLRLAYASCQRWEHGYYGAYRHMLAEDLDCVLFLGDYIYEYPGAANAVRSHGTGWADSLDSYRRRYALHKSDARLQAMHAACPWLVTWDDHEVQNDYAGAQAGNSGSFRGDFARRRAEAYQAFYEHMPLRASALARALAGNAGGDAGSGAAGAAQAEAALRVHGSVRFGTLACLHLLDARQFKDPQACGEGRLGSRTLDPSGCAEWNDPARSMLGVAQERWLDASLGANRDAAWSVIGQQTLVGRRDFRPGPDRFLWNDGWDGYPAARTRLTDSLRRHDVGNAVFFGGDVHENWVGHVKADYEAPSSPSVGVEFCGTSITSRSSGNDKLAERLAENPHFVFADAQARGYGIAEFTPERLVTTLRAVDDVTRPDTGIRTLARFAVQAGRPVVEAA